MQFKAKNPVKISCPKSLFLSRRSQSRRSHLSEGVALKIFEIASNSLLFRIVHWIVHVIKEDWEDSQIVMR